MNRGATGKWGASCEGLFKKMEVVYGTNATCRESGWRWFANPKPKSNSHDHRWWPPASSLHTLGIAQKVPMSTGQALSMMRLIEEGIDAAAAQPSELK